MIREDTLKVLTCELKVGMYCKGCKEEVRKILRKIDGVYKITIDVGGKVTVSGVVCAETIIKKLNKAGKKATLWGANPGVGCQPQALQLGNGGNRQPEDAAGRGHPRNVVGNGQNSGAGGSTDLTGVGTRDATLVLPQPTQQQVQQAVVPPPQPHQPRVPPQPTQQQVQQMVVPPPQPHQPRVPPQPTQQQVQQAVVPPPQPHQPRVPPQPMQQRLPQATMPLPQPHQPRVLLPEVQRPTIPLQQVHQMMVPRQHQQPIPNQPTVGLAKEPNNVSFESSEDGSEDEEGYSTDEINGLECGLGSEGYGLGVPLNNMQQQQGMMGGSLPGMAQMGSMPIGQPRMGGTNYVGGGAPNIMPRGNMPGAGFYHGSGMPTGLEAPNNGVTTRNLMVQQEHMAMTRYQQPQPQLLVTMDKYADSNYQGGTRYSGYQCGNPPPLPPPYPESSYNLFSEENPTGCSVM